MFTLPPLIYLLLLIDLDFQALYIGFLRPVRQTTEQFYHLPLELVLQLHKQYRGVYQYLEPMNVHYTEMAMYNILFLRHIYQFSSLVQVLFVLNFHQIHHLMATEYFLYFDQNTLDYHK